MALGPVEEACLKFSRLRHQTNSSLCYHKRRVCVRGEVRNGERFKEMANKRGYVRLRHSKTQKKVAAQNTVTGYKRNQRNIKRTNQAFLSTLVDYY